MSGRGRTRLDGRGAGARIAAGSTYVAAITILAAVAAWPIYRSLAFLILVLAAAVAATAIAATARALWWPGWLTALVAFGSLMVPGGPVQVPSRMASLPEAVAGLRYQRSRGKREASVPRHAPCGHARAVEQDLLDLGTVGKRRGIHALRRVDRIVRAIGCRSHRRVPDRGAAIGA